ncbi:MAG: hypothetical protein SWE60_21875, partial [Thermodesulfobacteriota bacterium]|nr:hypothetical protein [Thermodesulfobacteriota bacterium]
NDYIMVGACHKDERGRELWGPIIMYNDRTNTLRAIKRPMASGEPVEREMIARVAQGDMEADAEEFAVFPLLKEEVLKKPQPTVH